MGLELPEEIWMQGVEAQPDFDFGEMLSAPARAGHAGKPCVPSWHGWIRPAGHFSTADVPESGFMHILNARPFVAGAQSVLVYAKSYIGTDFIGT